MSDQDWIRAIGKYSGDRTDWSGDTPIGGARELARLLGTRAGVEPERFARLALTFDAGAPSAHICNILEAVAGKVSISLLSDLCVHARQIGGQDVGRALCRAIETLGADADDTLIRLLIECAADGDPDHEAARTTAWSGQFFYGGDLLTAGMNCTRGVAAQTVAALLFARPDLTQRLTSTVVALAADPILAVRVWAAEAVVALLNTDPVAAEDIAATLFEAPVDVLDATTSSRLLRYMLFRQPDRFTPHLVRGLDGPESVAERAGWVWAVAYVRDALVDPAPTDLGDLRREARRGAAAAFATDPAVAPDHLIRLFDDENVAVREAAAAAMRHIADLDDDVADRLIAEFTTSLAFSEHLDDLFSALAHSDRLMPKPTIAACERAVQVAAGELGDLRTARAAISSDIIEVVLRLYRQGDGATRTRCLDLVDRLIVSGAFGLEDALTEQR